MMSVEGDITSPSLDTRACIVCSRPSLGMQALMCQAHSNMIRAAQWGGSNGEHLAHNVLRKTQALLACSDEHEHVVGIEQLHLVGTPCPWCGEELQMVKRGWR